MSLKTAERANNMEFKLSNIGKANRRVELRDKGNVYFSIPGAYSGDIEILNDGGHLNVCLVGVHVLTACNLFGVSKC